MSTQQCILIVPSSFGILARLDSHKFKKNEFLYEAVVSLCMWNTSRQYALKLLKNNQVWKPTAAGRERPSNIQELIRQVSNNHNRSSLIEKTLSDSNDCWQGYHELICDLFTHSYVFLQIGTISFSVKFIWMRIKQKITILVFSSSISKYTTSFTYHRLKIWKWIYQKILNVHQILINTLMYSKK